MWKQNSTYPYRYINERVRIRNKKISEPSEKNDMKINQSASEEFM